MRLLEQTGMPVNAVYTFEAMYKHILPAKEQINDLLSMYRNKFKLDWIDRDGRIPVIRLLVSIEIPVIAVAIEDGTGKKINLEPIEGESLAEIDGGKRKNALVEATKQILKKHGIPEHLLSKDPEDFEFVLVEGEHHQTALGLTPEEEAE